MALNLNKNLKLYYSIKEVAEMFNVNESTLRYWETEFPYLKPKTSGPAKIRQYQQKDIDQIRLIHNLVKVRGFKLAAAKKIINANRDGADKRSEVLTRLIDVREQLQALKNKWISYNKHHIICVTSCNPSIFFSWSIISFTFSRS